MNFVLDASLALSWFFEDEQSAYADGVKQRLTDSRAVVPHLWITEVINGLLVAERRKRISSEAVDRVPAILEQLPIEVDLTQPNARELITLCRRHSLSTYDAIYISLAARQQIPIATNDKKLEAVCSAEGIVRFMPAA